MRLIRLGFVIGWPCSSFAIQSGHMNLLPLYRRPIFRTGMGLLLWVALYWLARHRSGDLAAIPLLLDLLLGIIAFILFLGLAAQFILPVQTGSDRFRAWGHLLRWVFGLRNPMFALRDGQIGIESSSRKPGNPGVILLDHHTAAVLQTDTELLPPQGPGLTFPPPKTKISDCLDLRPQRRSSRVHAKPSQEHRPTPASAVTKDGIPITADLDVIFMLDPGRRWAEQWHSGSNTRSPVFNPDAAEHAVLRHAYGDLQDLPWTDLPLTLVLDLWREEVHGLDLESFFGESKNVGSPLEKIRLSLIAKLSTPSAQATGAHAAHAILQSRGIRVLDLTIENLQLPMDVQKERNNIIFQNMAREAEKRAIKSKESQTYAREQGQRQAAQRVLESATTSLRTATQAGSFTDPATSLRLILEDSAVLAAREGLKLRGISLAQYLKKLSSALQQEPWESESHD